MNRLPALLVVIAAACGLASPAAAQTAADSAAIRATALDYAQGWYTGEADRMARALHPELAKRIVRTPNGRFTLQHMSAAQLTDATRSGGGRNTPENERQADVRILDVFGNTASVRLTMKDWIDYMHLARWEDRWVIINVLWEVKR